jgi:hypothetical protein
MAHAGEENKYCYHYNGCSLSVLAAPSNSCDYVTCYGEDKKTECGTHKLHRLKGLEKATTRKKAKADKPREAEPDQWEDTDFEENESFVDEEEEILEVIA